jgi:hypothetical protein
VGNEGEERQGGEVMEITADVEMEAITTAAATVSDC